MAFSDLPVPPFVLLGLLLTGGGFLLGTLLRLLAQSRGEIVRAARVTGAGILAAGVVFIAAGGWNTGPLPHELLSWLSWPIAPALIGLGLGLLTPKLRAVRPATSV